MVKNKTEINNDNELDDLTDEDKLNYQKEISQIDEEIVEENDSLKPEDTLGESDELKINEAIGDIVRTDSDKLMDSEDKEIASAFDPKPTRFKQKIITLYKNWWNNKKLRYATFAGIGVFIILIALIPPSRYFILNNVGVRSSTSLKIYDESSKYPLKNAKVIISGKTVKTDKEGYAKVTKIKLGRQKLSVQKRAFADVDKIVTIGWGSNPLGNIDLKPVGAQYTFYLTDWLSGKQITRGEANSGEYDANADKDGKIILTIDPNDDEDLDISISSPGYRTEKFKLDQSNKVSKDIKLVSNRKYAFFSRRNGSYDLYKIDVDGKNEQLVLKGSGFEGPEIKMISHPTAEIIAIVNTRDNVRNADGYLLKTLTIVDLKDNSSDQIVQSESIDLYGWGDDKLIYTQTVAGASAANAKRVRLNSYDYKKTEKKELFSANSFNNIMLVRNEIYYAPGNNYQPNSSNSYYRVTIDGTNRKELLGREVWSVFRTTYDKLDISAVGQQWYTLAIGEDKAFRSSVAPSSFSSRQYIDSQDNKKSLWVEDRDGKGTLLLYELQSQKDKVLKQQAGLTKAVRWLDNNILIYRISNQQETADYVLNINGGEAKKIIDITNTDIYSI